jgi:hypothetical protein
MFLKSHVYMCEGIAMLKESKEEKSWQEFVFGI